MRKYELTEIPDLWKNNVLSKQEVINYLAEFILDNKPLFNLQNYEEDVCSEIILKFLETSEAFLDNYNPELGHFPAYFYSYIISFIKSERKSLAQKSSDNRVYFQDIIINNEDKPAVFEPLCLSEKPKVPYSFKPITEEVLKNTIVPKVQNIDRKILVLAIRSAFYISDDQISKICKLYDVDDENLFTIIEYIRQGLSSKAGRRQELIERRNKAYFYHKKYENQIKLINENEYIYEPEQLKDNLIKKNEKHTDTWKYHNKKLQEGCMYLRPSNKKISELLGICERQVMYYLYCTKHQVFLSKTEENLEADNKEKLTP